MKCSNMDCGSSDKKCRPEYCSNNKNGASKSWGYCNMSHNPKWLQARCINTHRKKTKKTISVDAELLHKKMPYIWRFLKPKTRRTMIELAKQPTHKINVPFMVFTKDKHPTKKIKKLRKKYKHI